MDLGKCPNEYGIYQAMVSLTVPRHMRKENGGYYTAKTRIDIDRCLVEEIRWLWSLGIRTYGCCCGHGRDLGIINVDEKDTLKMVELGYEYVPNIPKGLWPFTFLPKSKHR